jgi:RNA polymerase sigma factor (sigma-70 family)
MVSFQQGQSTAYDTLYARHAGAVRGYLTRLVQNAATAADLTQATFLSVFRARDRFSGSQRFKPWLYAIATNAARDWRRHARFETVSEDGATPDGVYDGPGPRDVGLERQVWRALESLPEAQREAIVLHRFQGLSFSEIAELAQVSESAVKVRAHRGYERLRELLAEVKP